MQVAVAAVVLFLQQLWLRSCFVPDQKNPPFAILWLQVVQVVQVVQVCAAVAVVVFYWRPSYFHLH